MNQSTKEIIVLPNILNNTTYVAGLCNPLETIADTLDLQNKIEYARALREAAVIVDTYVKVCMTKTATLSI